AVTGTGTGSIPASLTPADLKAMLSVDVGNVIDNTHTTGTIHWAFNSTPQAFDFLASNETLVLNYTVRATDSDGTPAHDDQLVTVTITGTNDTPDITVGAGDSAAANLTEGNAALSGSGTLTVSDADLSNT